MNPGEDDPDPTREKKPGSRFVPQKNSDRNQRNKIFLFFSLNIKINLSINIEQQEVELLQKFFTTTGLIFFIQRVDTDPVLTYGSNQAQQSSFGVKILHEIL